MKEPSVFTRIINGEIPAHRVYEDVATLVILDIHPAQPGHMLVIPKVQTDRLELLDEEIYTALMTTLKKAMRRVTQVFGESTRACVKVEGFDVPHAHIHVIPCHTVEEFWAPQRMDRAIDHSALTDMAKKLAF